MKTKPTYKTKLFNAVLAGSLVWLVCMSITVPAAWAAPGHIPPAQEGGTPSPDENGPAMTEAPKDCAECHPDIQSAWIDSPHAHAFDDQVFSERWESLGEPGECLVCHTTGYTASSDSFTSEGVTCESCHGPAVEGHPPAVVPMRADTEYCGTCHTTTLGEWRLTGHAFADVGCTDCHNPHNQKALFENPNELCINCHKDDIGEHQNDIHLTKDIGCVDCHAMVLPPETPPADGLIPTGHSFTITPATCVACHTDTLHIGKPLPGYEDGAKAVSASLPVTSTVATVVSEYTGGTGENDSLPASQTVQALQATLASVRLSTLFQGGIIGLVLGGSTAYFLARNQRSLTEGEGTGEDEEKAEDE